MTPGLVTTVIPVHNRAAMLREAVDSVLAQTYRPIEIIVVDDGSSDDTPRVADELARAHPDIVRVIHQPNGGVGSAREAGRLAARGEFIQHLDSDDLIYPRKFELQVTALQNHPECGVAYGWTRTRRADGSAAETPERRTSERLETMFPAMLATRWWQTATPLYRASLVHAAGPWTNLRAEEDWEYDARIAALGPRLCYVAEWVSEARDHGEGRLTSRALSPEALRDRAVAHALIYRHARRAGIGSDVPEMQRFSRELFLLSRQCGAAGLASASEELFGLAREASGERRDSIQFRAYAVLARTVGWRAAGRLACMSDYLRW